jgi:hypothetical protein
MKTLALLFFIGGPAIGFWLYWSADQKVQLAEQQRTEATQRIAKPAANVLINGGDLNSLLDEVRPYKEALDRAEADRKSSMYLGIGAAALGIILGFSCQSAASKRT